MRAGTSDGAAAEAISGHADNLEQLRYRLEAVRFTSALMVRDNAMFGTMSGWIAHSLEVRAERQDELVDYVVENLAQAVRKLRATALAYAERADAGAASDPDAPPVFRAAYWRPDGWTPAQEAEEQGPRLVDQIQPLIDEINGRGWADDRLADGNAAAVTSAGHSGSPMEHFMPMRELLAQLVGNPAHVAAQAKAWNDMAAELHRIAEALERHLDGDLSEWHGVNHAAYQSLMSSNVDAIGGTGATAAALGAAVEGASAVTSSTLWIVRAQSVALAAHATAAVRSGSPETEEAVASLPLVAMVAEWTLTVMGHLTALARSLGNLKRLLGPDPDD